jgi:hypothetical protein
MNPLIRRWFDVWPHNPVNLFCDATKEAEGFGTKDFAGEVFYPD